MKRRNFFSLATVSGLLSRNIPANESDEETKEGLSNGRRWNRIGWSDRVWLVRGILDGIAEASFEVAAASSKPVFDYRLNDTAVSLGKGLSLKHATYGEVCDGVSAFFSDPANLNIGVIDAMKIHISKAKGDPPSAIEARIAELRRAQQ
jgi:hypothetical protein